MLVKGTGRFDRRRILTGLGALGASRYLAACSSTEERVLDQDLPPDENVCLLTPAQTEGPFFFDTGFMRSDIRDDKPGVNLALGLRVVEAGSCMPVAGALVEVWHADADGVYSAFDTADGNSANAGGQTFLRGFQETDADGNVQFLTVYPGWYPGRTPHIHLMVLIGGRELLTTQLYFPEGVTDAVYAEEPYAARGRRSTSNAADGVGAPRALIGEYAEVGDGWGTEFRLVLPG
jgi:protocatechuate 3,4-dioxygenase beta subunit